MGSTVEYTEKLLIKPPYNSRGNIIRKIGDVIKRAKAWKQEELIDVLNPIITGWLNYHRSAVTKVTFSKLDLIVWNVLWGGG